MQATDAKTRYHGYCISPPSEKLPASHDGAGTPCTSLPTTRLPQLLEDQDERVSHQHLLQVVALVEEAEEHPLEQVAEDRGEHDADDEPGHDTSRRTSGASANARYAPSM